MCKKKGLRVGDVRTKFLPFQRLFNQQFLQGLTIGWDEIGFLSRVGFRGRVEFRGRYGFTGYFWV